MDGPSACQGDKGSNYDCEDLDPWQCYSNTAERDCCRTCADIRYSLNSTVPGCQYGDRQGECMSIVGPSGSYCYYNMTRTDCCYTCYYLSSGIQGCQFGDRVDGCSNTVGPSGRFCYDGTIRHDCCDTCYNFETTVPGCKYGDREGGCQPSKCTTSQQIYECCDTCYGVGTTSSTTQAPATNAPSGRQGSPSTPDWVIPVVASAAGVIVVLAIILVVCFCIRRRRKKPDVISDEMYNEYKLSKRAPVAPPRPDPEVERRSVLKRQDSAEYAYINPDDVKSDQVQDKNSLSKRPGNDPLPDRPKDYVYLTNPDKYGYLEPIQKSRTPGPYAELQADRGQPDPYTNLNHGNEADRRRQNSYGEFPQVSHYNRGNTVESEKL